MLKNTSWLVIGRIVSDGLSFVFYLALARTFGEAGLGDYYLAFTLATLAGIAIEFGLRPLLTRSIARKPELASRYWSALVVLQISLAMVVGLVIYIWCLAAGYSRELNYLVALAFIGTALRAFAMSYVAFLEAIEAMDKSAILEVIARFTSVALGLALIIAGAQLQTVMLAQLLGSAVYLGLAAYWMRQRFGPLIFAADKALIRITFLAALPFVGAYMLEEVHVRAGVILLHQLVGETATGQYAAANRTIVTPLAWVFLVGVAIYPRLSQSADADSVKQPGVFLLTLKWLSILGVSGAIILISIGDKLLVTLFGQEFAVSGDLVRLMSILFITGSIKVPYERLLFASNREKIPVRFHGLSFMVNIVFNLLLIPIWGVFGTVGAAIISDGCLILGLHLSSYKLIQARYISLAIRLSLAAVCGVLVGILLRDLILWPLVAVVACLAFLGATMLLRVITVEDGRRLIAALNRSPI